MFDLAFEYSQPLHYWLVNYRDIYQVWKIKYDNTNMTKEKK